MAGRLKDIRLLRHAARCRVAHVVGMLVVEDPIADLVALFHALHVLHERSLRRASCHALVLKVVVRCLTARHTVQLVCVLDLVVVLLAFREAQVLVLRLLAVLIGLTGTGVAADPSALVKVWQLQGTLQHALHVVLLLGTKLALPNALLNVDRTVANWIWFYLVEPAVFYALQRTLIHVRPLLRTSVCAHKRVVLSFQRLGGNVKRRGLRTLVQTLVLLLGEQGIIRWANCLVVITLLDALYVVLLHHFHKLAPLCARRHASLVVLEPVAYVLGAASQHARLVGQLHVPLATGGHARLVLHQFAYAPTRALFTGVRREERELFRALVNALVLCDSVPERPPDVVAVAGHLALVPPSRVREERARRVIAPVRAYRDLYLHVVQSYVHPEAELLIIGTFVHALVVHRSVRAVLSL